MGRREHIGDAGVRLIARDGVHALTHLQVDTEAGLPRGSTSYYARTRRDLLALVVNRLSDGSQADINDLFELRDDVELRELLTAEAPVRRPLTSLAERILVAADVDQASVHASDLVGLVDALLMYQAAKAAPVDARKVLRAYLEGLGRPACSAA